MKLGEVPVGATVVYRGETYTKQPSLHGSLSTIRGRRDERFPNNTEVIMARDVYKIGDTLLVREIGGWETLKGEAVLVAGEPRRATCYEVYVQFPSVMMLCGGKPVRAGDTRSDDPATLCDGPEVATNDTTFGELEIGETFVTLGTWRKTARDKAEAVNGTVAPLRFNPSQRCRKTTLADAKPGDTVSWFSNKSGVVQSDRTVVGGRLVTSRHTLPEATVVRIEKRGKVADSVPRVVPQLFEVLIGGDVFCNGKQYAPDGTARDYSGEAGTGRAAPRATGGDPVGTVLLRDCGTVRNVVAPGKVTRASGGSEGYCASFYAVLGVPHPMGSLVKHGGREWVVVGSRMYATGETRVDAPVAGERIGEAVLADGSTPAGAVLVFEGYAGDEIGSYWEVMESGRVKKLGEKHDVRLSPKARNFVLHVPMRRVKRYDTIVIGGERFLVLDTTVPSGKPFKLLRLKDQCETLYNSAPYEVL